MYKTIGKSIQPFSSNQQFILNKPGLQEVEHDSRLMYGHVRGFEKMQLDRKPLSGSFTSEQIKNNPINLDYKSVTDINFGNDVYYIVGSMGQAYYRPVYGVTTPVTARIFQDPMDTIKPQYDREMQYTQANIIGNQFMQDTMYHREDIMALQQRKNNQERLEPLLFLQ